MTTNASTRLDAIGEPLHQVTFVVVDLETTGGSARHSAITEIGAVKVRGGEVLGEFHTLVDPGTAIPPFIVALTGITDVMVSMAPRIDAVLPMFLEFATGSVLVAHNAPFDIGFLKSACRSLDYRWPGFDVVDTVTMARRATTKEEAPNKKLATLARVFGAHVTPTHRALDDARATVDVFHGLLERLAAMGVTHRRDLATLTSTVPEHIRRKSHLADAVPEAPGVYVFYGHDDEPLYVGTSAHLRSRVKSYFTKAEKRAHVRDMVTCAARIATQVTPTPLEAQVLEVRLIHSLTPRFNKRSTRPGRQPWLAMSDEPHPRVVVTRTARPGGDSLGPFSSASMAREVAHEVAAWAQLRTCTTRLPREPRPDARPCLAKDLGRCLAPCVNPHQAASAPVERTRSVLEGDVSQVIAHFHMLIGTAAARRDYESAAHVRDVAAALVQAASRRDRLRGLQGASIVAARYTEGGWDIVGVKNGRLVATRRTATGPWLHAHDLRERSLTCEHSEASIEEQELVAQWLERPGVRLMHVDGEWSWPVASAARFSHYSQATKQARELMR